MSIKTNNVGHVALFLSLSKVINLALRMTAIILLTRTLTLSDYGTYSELLVVISLIVSFMVIGLPNSLNYFIPSLNIRDKIKFLNFYFITISVIGFACAAFIFIFNMQIVSFYNNPNIAEYLFFLLTIPWTTICITSRANLLIASAKAKREILYSILNNTFILLISISAYKWNFTLKQYLWCYVVIEIVFALIVYIEAWICAHKKIVLQFDFNLIKSVFTFSIPMGLSLMLSTICIDLDKLIIGYNMSEQFVAIYANAGKELPFTYISASFSAVILPMVVKYISTNNKLQAIELWKNSTYICFVILTFCSATSIVFAPQILTLLYSDKYLDGVGIFRIYSLSLLLRITYWGTILNAYGKTKQILYNAIACLIINIILSILLFKTIGFVGPAIATVMSILVMAWLQLIYSSKLTKMKVHSMFLWFKMLKAICICLLLFSMVYLFVNDIYKSTDIKDLMISAMTILLIGGIYFFLLYEDIMESWKKCKSHKI